MNRLSTFLVSLAATILVACSNSSDKLVSWADSHCPIDINDVGYINHISLHADTLVYDCIITNGDISIDDLNERKTTIAATMAESLPMLFEDDPELLTALKKNNWILSVRYSSREPGKRFQLDFNPDDIGRPSPLSPEEQLQNEIAVSSTSLPFQIADGVFVTDFYATDSEIVYDCLVDEDEAGDDAMQNLRENAQALQIHMLRALNDPSDPETVKLTSVAKQTNRVIVYRYRGSISGDTLSVRLDVR